MLLGAQRYGSSWMDKLGRFLVHRNMCVYISESQVSISPPTVDFSGHSHSRGGVSPHVRGVLVLTHPRDDGEVPASSVLLAFRCSEALQLSGMASNHLQGWSLP